MYALYLLPGGGCPWDVSPDGQQLLMIKESGAATTDGGDQLEIVLVLNWFEELTRLVPVD